MLAGFFSMAVCSALRRSTAADGDERILRVLTDLPRTANRWHLE